MVSAGQIADAIAGRRNAVNTRYVWQRRTLAYGFRDTLTTAILKQPRLDLDNNRAVLRSLTGIELRESALPVDFDPTLDNIAVIEERLVAGAWQPFPIGLFRLLIGDTRHGTDGEPVIECDAADVGMLLMESGPDAPYTVASAANYRSEITDIFDALGLAYDLTALASTLPLSITWPAYPETTWWSLIRDLAYGVGYYVPWPGERGVFTWRLLEVTPDTSPAAVTFSDMDEPKFIDGATPYRRRQDAGTLRNVARVVIDNVDHPNAGTLTTRTNADAASPISTVSRGFSRPFDITGASTPFNTRAILSATIAQNIGDHALRLEAAKYRTADLTTLPDPRRTAHEFAALDIEGVESSTLWRVASWSRELRSGARMSHRLEQVEAVTIS